MNAATAAVLAETETSYTAAVRRLADDVIRQMEDGDAPRRRCTTLAAGGHYFENVRVYYADLAGDQAHGIPRGVVRVALDMSRPRRPAHEVRVCFDGMTDTVYDADAIALAVLDMIDNTANYAR